MAEMTFKLDVFEGPLDLLLHLISKHQLNINDIEITKLLEQYLIYMDQARQQDLELAGEFLEMAARLVYIKSASLLPKPEEAERIKRELQGALIEYALCQQAAGMLRESFIADDVFVRKPMKIKVDQTYRLQHSPEKLAQALAQIGKTKGNGQKLSEKITDTVTQTKVVSVISKVMFVLRRLYAGNTVSVQSLYDGISDKSARVATFLAVLELTRFGRIELNEDNTMLSMKEKKGG
ncbi:MAG: segregation/condensation protein A [Oscillospiraceae bacterium]|nr:segregation/condensation protein A [Oscillospiraceae bacterium]